MAGLISFAPAASHAEETFGQALKRVFNPTPTPAPKKKKGSTTAKKKSAATPSPASSAGETKASPSPTPKHHRRSHKQAAGETATPSPTPEATATPSQSPAKSPSPSAKGKKKKKSSPTPTPEESPTPSPSPSATPSPSPNEKKEKPPGVSISTSEISGFDSYPEPVKRLIESALQLASRNLTYKYGSADPDNGGMDCSGFVYYLLKQNGIAEVPRDSSSQYVWVRKSGKFEAVVSRSDDTFELANLKPGDLMFWTGTYDINRDPPITHAMIYLGKEKGSGRRIMVGASDGRTYHDESRYGVSVFDFRVSRPGRAASNGRTPDFVGYGRIPGLGD